MHPGIPRSFMDFEVGVGVHFIVLNSVESLHSAPGSIKVGFKLVQLPYDAVKCFGFLRICQGKLRDAENVNTKETKARQH